MNLENAIKYLKNKIETNNEKIIENEKNDINLSCKINELDEKISSIISTVNKLTDDDYENKKNYADVIIGGTKVVTNDNFSNNTLNNYVKTDNIIDESPAMCSIYSDYNNSGEYNSATGKYEFKIKISNSNDSSIYTYSLQNSLYYATNDVRDEIDMVNNKAVRRVLYKKFIGQDSENWELVSNKSDKKTLLFKSGKISNIKLPKSDTDNLSQLMHVTCNKLSHTLVQHQYLINNDIEGVSIDSDGCLRVAVLKSKLSSQDLSGFKNWLKDSGLSIGFVRSSFSEVKLSTNYNIVLYPDSTVEFLSKKIGRIKIQYTRGIIPAIKELKK